MKRASVFSMIMLVSVLVGCSAVYSTKPVGLEPAPIESGDWKGTWVFGNSAVEVDVIDADKGLLRVAWIKDMKLKFIDVHLQTSDDWMFGSTKEDPEDKNFVWGRIKREDNQLIIWNPSVSKFKKMVEDGILPGVVDNTGNVVLGELTSDHISLIASEGNGVLFDWEDPDVFRRLTE